MDDSRTVDKANNQITIPCSFPDERLNRQGFNPLIYPDLHLACKVRVKAQAETVMFLALAYEEFGVNYDNTFIDQENRHVEIHQPDSRPDILQQVEHGTITILNGYKQLGRLYRGIICPTLRQYVHLGDAATLTDNKVFDNEAQKAKAANLDGMWYKKVAHRYSKAFDPQMNLNEIQVYNPDMDDRLVFPSSQPGFQLRGAVGLVTGSRVLKGYNDPMARECLQAAEDIWEKNKKGEGRSTGPAKISLLAELIIATRKETYKQELYAMTGAIEKEFESAGWSVARVMPLLDNPSFKEAITRRARAYKAELDKITNETPFGCPLRTPERLGFSQYYLHKVWPYIWQEREYIIHGACRYMSIVLAADHLLDKGL